MRPNLVSALTGLALFLASTAGAAASPKATFTIKGMTCGGCVAAVKLQLGKTEGVTAYEVSLAKGEADVTYDPGKTDPKRIAESVSRTGFQATVKDAGRSNQPSLPKPDAAQR